MFEKCIIRREPQGAVPDGTRVDISVHFDFDYDKLNNNISNLDEPRYVGNLDNLDNFGNLDNFDNFEDFDVTDILHAEIENAENFEIN